MPPLRLRNTATLLASLAWTWAASLGLGWAQEVSSSGGDPQTAGRVWATSTEIPEWTRLESTVVDGVEYRTLQTDVCLGAEEVDAELDRQLAVAVARFASEKISPAAGAELSLPPGELRRWLSDRQLIPVDVSIARDLDPPQPTLYRGYARLKCDAALSQYVAAAWETQQVQRRAARQHAAVFEAATVLAGLFALVAAAHACLRLNQLTESRRAMAWVGLFFASAAAIAVAVAAALGLVG